MKRLREAAALVGPGALRLLGAGVAAGVLLSLVEIAFAGVLQSFLVAVGALSPGAASLPSFLPALTGPAVFAALVAVGAARASLVGAGIYLQGAAGEEVKLVLRAKVIDRLFRARSANSAETMTIFSARTEALGAAAAATQTLASQAATGAVLLAGLLQISPGLTAAAVGIFAVAALPLRAADLRARHSGHTLGVEWQRITERLLASARNLLLLQILGTQIEERGRTLHHLDEYRKHVLVYYAVSAFKVALPQILGLAVVCGIAALSGRSGALAPGALVSYFYLFLRLVQVAAGASQSATTLAHLGPQLEEVLAWSGRTDEEIPPVPAGRPAASVGFRVVGAAFRYPGAREDAVRKTDLDLAPGEALVIIGPSGAGKSTLLSLLLGLLEPSAGAVDAVLDGEAEPASAARGRLLPSLGYVGPESFLIEGDIRDNLRYGLSREPDDAEIEAALAAAECGFLNALPRGLGHRLTEQGQGLSAGQKQRLALARALLRRPAVLILDEATSNLDAETEARIVETLSRLKGRMTIVAVSHRPALLALADRRLILDGAEPPNGTMAEPPPLR